MKLLIILLIALLVSPVTALFGLGRKKKREEEAKAKEAAAAAAAATAPTSTIDPIDAVNVGMDNLMKTMADPDTLKQTMEMMQDPDTMAEVEKLMSSPEFKAEMEALMDKPEMKAAMEAATEFMQDPEKLKKFYTDLAEGMTKLGEEALGQDVDGKTSAAMGLEGLAAAAKNPNILGETLKMLDDPDVQKEVQKLMNDESFKSEIEGMMALPEYQEAMKKAQEDLAELSKDPTKLAEMQAKARAMLNA